MATALGLPLYDKDEILEALLEHLGSGDAQSRLRLSRAADDVLQRQVLHSQGAVIVSWWRHPLSRVQSGTSIGWLSSLTSAPIEFHCKCNPKTAAKRFLARKRHAGHLDDSRSHAELLTNLEQFASHGPLGLSRVVEVNTETRPDISALLDSLVAINAT